MERGEASLEPKARRYFKGSGLAAYIYLEVVLVSEEK